MNDIAILLISLGIILLGAEVFTNGVEWLGLRLNLSEGAVGSLLAAVGTALPETMIPLLALTLEKGSDAGKIGIGAILGAPLMLSTLAIFVTGVGVIAFRRRRTSGTEVTADPEVMKRDLGFFIIVFTAALLEGVIPMRNWQLVIAVFMVLSYLFYVWVTLQDERAEGEEEMRPCYFAPKKDEPAMIMILLQLLIALGLIVGGAHLFVGGVESVAQMYGLPAFVLALVIAPIATELPEKFNSVIWVSRGKDTLALGNITGAMVFQSSLIPAMGIFLTPWKLTAGALITGVIALAAAVLLYLEVTKKSRMTARTLLISGSLYVLFFILVIERIIR